jgi:hypothetical protein
MSTYMRPSVKEVGSLHELTLSGITKAAGSGDVIYINGEANSVPGSSVISVS